MTLSLSPSPANSPASSPAAGQEFQAYQYALSQFAGVAVADLSGKIVEVNDRLCELLQYDRSELIGRPYSQFESRIQSETEAQRLWQAIAEGLPWRGKIRHCTRDGSHCWLDMSVVPQLNTKGQVHRYLFAGQDITAQCQQQENQHQQRNQLTELKAHSKSLKIRLDGNNHILNLIVNGAPLQQSLTAIAELTETLSHNLYCAIMVVDPISGRLIHKAGPSLSAEFIEMMDELPITSRGGAFAAAAHTQRTIVVPDIAADTHAHYVNDVALQEKLRACWACPILVRGRVAAVVGMYYPQPQYPSETDQSLMARAVEVTQVAMERHRSETSLRSKLEQTLLLGQITQEIRQSLDTQEIFHTVVTQVRSLLQADRVVIAHFDSNPESHEHFIAEDVLPPFCSILGLPLARYTIGNAAKATSPEVSPQVSRATSTVTSQPEAAPFLPFLKSLGQNAITPQVVEDIYYSDLDDEQIALMETLEIQASLAIPILVGASTENAPDNISNNPAADSETHRPWGMLYIQQCSGPRRWQESEISFVQALTAQLSVALQQANLLSQAQQKSDRLQQLLATVQRQKLQQSRVAERERVVSRVIQQIHKTRDIAKIMATTTEEARTLLNCDRVLIYRFLPDWHREIAHESFGPELPALKQTPQPKTWVDHYIQRHQGGRYRNGESAIVSDIYESDYSDPHIRCFEQRAIRAFIVIPIFIGEKLWGLMGAYQHNTPRDWKFEDLSSLERITGQLGVAFQQAELLKQLKTAKDKADTANKAKGTFLANMSHELRTPLNAILGFSQLMHRDAATTPNQRETLNIINRSGAHLLSLINDVLEMSKIEAGSMVLHEEDFDLHALCDSVHEMFRLKASSKGLMLKLERDSSVPQYIHSDERKLRQILTNLISNSLKFTSQGSITLKMWRGESIRLDPMTSLSNAPIRLWFSISDTGAGIDPSEMGQLFNAFTQSESGRLAQEGTGLGLPISQEFVKLMGGELTLESQINQGTQAQFSVVVPPVVGKVATPTHNQRVIAIAPGQPEYRLLVVEDRPENRILLTRLLECVGFSVRTAPHGQAAISQWQDWKPHLIWMDLKMPVMDGFEATRTIRTLEAEAQGSNEPSERETFILALTASAFEETRSLTLEAGFDDFIRKPFEEGLIFNKIAQYLGVEYSYEASEAEALPAVEAPSQQLNEEQRQELIQQQCHAMGAAWRDSLYNAAVTLEESVVLEHIQTLEGQHPELKSLLTNWAQTLRLDKIAELIQPSFQNSA